MRTRRSLTATTRGLLGWDNQVCPSAAARHGPQLHCLLNLWESICANGAAVVFATSGCTTTLVNVGFDGMSLGQGAMLNLALKLTVAGFHDPVALDEGRACLRWRTPNTLDGRAPAREWGEYGVLLLLADGYAAGAGWLISAPHSSKRTPSPPMPPTPLPSPPSPPLPPRPPRPPSCRRGSRRRQERGRAARAHRGGRCCSSARWGGVRAGGEQLNASLTLRSAGAGAASRRGRRVARAAAVGGATLTLDGLTVANGVAVNGGCIHVSGGAILVLVRTLVAVAADPTGAAAVSGAASTSKVSLR